MELKLLNPKETIKYYERIMNDFRMFTMAIAEEEEVLKFYFYSKHLTKSVAEMILTEIVIDRGEKTIGFIFKYENKQLFDYWYSQLLDYLRTEKLVD